MVEIKSPVRVKDLEGKTGVAFTFRHWKATMEYAKTKDILYVMRLLGHKSFKNTLVYPQLIEFKENEFVCKVAKTVHEASDLIENGFEFVCGFDDAKLFRKRK